MKTRIALIAISLMFAALALHAQNALYCADSEGLAADFNVPAGRGTRQVTLTLTMETWSCEAAAFRFSINGGTPLALDPNGSDPHYSALKKHVVLRKSVARSVATYTLTVKLDEGATWTAAENWSVSVTGLVREYEGGARNTIAAVLASRDGGVDPVSFTSTWSWRGKTIVPVPFTVSGARGADEAVVYVKIDAAVGPAAPAFGLLPAGKASKSLVELKPDGQPWPSDGILNNGAGHNFTLSGVPGAAGWWKLSVRRDAAAGGKAQSFVADLASILVVRNVNPADIVNVFCAGRNEASRAMGLVAGLVRLRQPPLPVITAPDSSAVTYVKGRSVALAAEVRSPEAVSGLAYSWTISNGSKTERFSSALIPESPFREIKGTDYGRFGVYRIVFTASETLAAVRIDPVTNSLDLSASVAVDVTLTGEETAGFPLFRSVRTHLQPPVIDGFIADDLPPGIKLDTGWRAAARITLANGLFVPNVAFQGLKEAKGDFLDLSFEVRHDPSLDSGDAVVIGVRPGQGGASSQEGDVVFILYPFSGKETAGAVGGNALSRVEVWKFTGGSWKDVGAQVTGLRCAVRAFSTSPDSFGWDLELKVPANTQSGGAQWVNIPDQFYFYFNVLRVQTGERKTVSQFYWPRQGNPLRGELAPAALTPGSWGRADKSDSFEHKGLWIAPQDLTISPADKKNESDDFLVNYDNSVASINSFTVKVNNDTAQAVGTQLSFLDAGNVSVNFRSADWGIAGANPGPDWRKLDEQFTPEKGFVNPAKPKTVPMADNETKPGTATFEFRGNIGPALPAGMTTAERRCLYAELLAQPGTYFREPGVYRNMVLSTAPALEESAVLSVRGFGPPPGGRTAHAYMLRTERKSWLVRNTVNPFAGQEIRSTEAVGDENKSDINSYLEWTFHGSLLTGETVTVRGEAFEIALPTGSFGYRLRRPAEVRSWNEYITNARRLDENTYLLDIPADQTVQIKAGYRTDESTGLYLAARAGAAIPMSLYAGNYSVGPSPSLEFGIKATQMFSFFLGVGYNFLVEPSGGNGFNMFFALLDVRIAMEFNPVFYMYLQGGLFGYTPDFAFFDLGVNFGLSGGFVISRSLSLEAGVTYMAGLSQDHTVMLLLTQVGLVLKF
jgi:hypothetical protein